MAKRSLEKIKITKTKKGILPSLDTFKKDRNSKCTHKLNESDANILLDLIVKSKIERVSQRIVADEFHKLTGLKISTMSVSLHTSNNREEIAKRMVAMAQQLVKDCPTLIKEYRMMQIDKIFDSAQSSKIALMALREMRAEQDERGDKFVKALENLSIGNIYFDLSKCDDVTKIRAAKDIRRCIDLGITVPRG